MSNIEVVGLGALNIDYLYQVERILNDGEAVVDETKSSPGGSAANTIYGLAKLGVNTGFAGVVGDEHLSVIDQGGTVVQVPDIGGRPYLGAGHIVAPDTPAQRDVHLIICHNGG